MKKQNFAYLLLFLSVSILTACSKSSETNNNNSTYYMTATVGGKAWAANITGNSFNSPVLAGITSAGGKPVVFVLGIYASNKDTSAFAVIFPQDNPLNENTTFDESKFSESAYIYETSPGSAIYNGFNTTPAKGGSGIFAISVFDQTNKVIEGTFQGTFGPVSGGTAITVTNGKFRCPYTTDFSEVSKLSGTKF